MAHLTIYEKYKIPIYDNPKHIIGAELVFDYDKCKECGFCMTACAAGAIITDQCNRKDIMTGKFKGKTGKPYLKKVANGKVTMCAGCMTCAGACPHGVITIKNGFSAKYRLKKLCQAPEMTFPKRY